MSENKTKTNLAERQSISPEGFNERVKKFRLSQLEILYRDESVDRKIKILLPELMRRVREDEDINVENFFAKSISDTMRDAVAGEYSQNTEMVRKIKKILTDDISDMEEVHLDSGDLRAFYLSKHSENMKERREKGDSLAMRPFEADLLEKQDNHLYEQYRNADTDEKREAVQKQIARLAEVHQSLWREFLEYRHEQALRENGQDRFEYYEPMYHRAVILTQKDFIGRLNFSETVELKDIVQTLVWTILIKAKKRNRYVKGDLEEEIANFKAMICRELSKDDEMRLEKSSSFIQRLREEIAKEEQKQK